MSRTKVEEVVHAEGGDVRVRRERDSDVINVTFPRLCSPGVFNLQKLRECIYYVEEYGYDLWLLLRDSNEQDFYAHVESNELHVRESLAGSQRTGVVPWEHLRESLEDAIGD